MSGTLRGVRACVFDAYGTLFDFGSAAAGCRDVLGDKTAALTSLWRDKQLQYTWLRTTQNRYVDFWQVTSQALDYALDALDITTPQLRGRLMDLYLQLRAFPEVPETLRRLREMGVKTAILSNGSPRMLAAVVEHNGLGDLLDEVLSVDAVGVYKTHPKTYQMAVDRLGVPVESISFQSSNAWDAYAASDFGMRVVWCNRYGQRPERLPGRPNMEIRSLTLLPDIIVAAD